MLQCLVLAYPGFLLFCLLVVVCMPGLQEYAPVIMFSCSSFDKILLTKKKNLCV